MSHGFWHAVVATVISVVLYVFAWFLLPLPEVFLACTAGAMFYIGREYVQWEKYEPKMDWEGLLSPVLWLLLVYGFIVLIYGDGNIL